MDIVHSFATALDKDDYATALFLLEPDATYQRDADFIRGAPAIVESFRKISDWGKRNLDALEFYHEIDAEASPLEIIFIDILRSEGDKLEIRHRMHVAISESGLIGGLHFSRPEGEKEVLSEFFRRHQLLPPGSE